MTATLRLHGHACFELALPSGRRLVVDPYEADSFGGRIALRPLADCFDLAIATHPHHDHAAFDSVPGARVVAAPYTDEDVQIVAFPASHDEYGGRLRGGMVQLLGVTVAHTRILFGGDLGERPMGALLARLRAFAADVLVLPVGGYFTLDADGAAELTALLAPRAVVPCHAREQGARFEELGSTELFTLRFERRETADELRLPLPPSEADVAASTRLVVLRPLAAR